MQSSSHHRKSHVLWLQNETKNFLFSPSCCLLPVSIWRTISQTPQVPFCCCMRQQDLPSLKFTDRRHLHPSLFTGCSSPSPWSTAHSHRTHPRLVLIKMLLAHPTLVPINNCGTWSISDICPQSSSFWGNLMLLKSLRPSTLSMTPSLPGPLCGLFNEVTNPLSPFGFLSFLL